MKPRWGQGEAKVMSSWSWTQGVGLAAQEESGWQLLAAVKAEPGLVTMSVDAMGSRGMS